MGMRLAIGFGGRLEPLGVCLSPSLGPNPDPLTVRCPPSPALCAEPLRVSRIISPALCVLLCAPFFISHTLFHVGPPSRFGRAPGRDTPRRRGHFTRSKQIFREGCRPDDIAPNPLAEEEAD